MPSDAFIGILTGLGSAHRERQKNIFDQEVDRRSRYEQFLQKAATDPNYRPEAQEQFANLYTTLLQTPYEKKLPKDFERKISDAVTSVQGTTNLSQGGPPQSESVGDTITGKRVETPEPPPFKGRMPARFSPDEKFAEAMRLINAQLQARSGAEIETEKAKLAMQPDEAFAFPRGAGIATRRGNIIQQPEIEPEQSPLDKEVDTFTSADGYRVTTYQRHDGSTYERKSTSKVQPPSPTQPPYMVRVEGAIGDAAQELPREWRNVATRAMPPNTPAATRLARMKEVASYLEAGDVEGLKSRVRQLAIEGESVGTQAQVEGRADALVAMKDGLQLLNEMKQAGVPTNILTGTWEEILRKLGTTSHHKRVEFASRMQRALSAYTLAMSGVQFSEAEAKRYYELFPNASNTLLVNETLAKSLLQSMGAEDKRFWTQKLGPDGAQLVGATAGVGQASQSGLNFDGFTFPNQQALDEYKRRTNQ